MKRSTFLALLITLFFSACSNDKDEAQVTTLKVQINLPDNYNWADKADFAIIATGTSSNATTKATTAADGTASLLLSDGLYHISIKGEKSHQVEGIDQTVVFQYANQNVAVSGKEQTLIATLEAAPLSKSWVIKEIYFSGSKTPSNGNYWQDQYIELYNNTDQVLYADGLCISESEHTTINPATAWTDLLPSKVAAGTIYGIGGNGTDYPVQPGQSIVLASNGSNHKALNPKSPVDLSKANFEWYDEHALDVDVPEVPNLIKHYSYSLSVWILHNRGYRSYFIFKPDTDMPAFLEKNKVETTNAAGKVVYRYAIPTDLILDGVELSQHNALNQKALPAAIDAGYSYCDNANSGLVVRRKVLRTEGNRTILQDTNNSKEDFLPNQVPSPFVIPQ